MNFKNIHIGQMIEKRVTETGAEMSRLCNFFKCTEDDIQKMYKAKSLDTELLLKWSKILEYDFFRSYTQHLILYSPSSNQNHIKTRLPEFRKNIYTKEIIYFILEQINENKMTKNQVMKEYNIPKTTLYKWIIKYRK